MMRDKRKEAEAVSVRPTTIETIIGENTEFEGVVTASTTMRIDGVFKGEIKSEGTVIVGENGKVIGKVNASSIFISGTVEGDIFISDRTEFASTGYLEGNITTNLLIIAEGAAFDGTCTMRKGNAANKVVEMDEAKKAQAQNA